MAFAPWETPAAPAGNVAAPSTTGASFAPWEAPASPPQTAPVGVGRTGLIDRSGLPPSVPSEAVLNSPPATANNAPPLEVPAYMGQPAHTFDYSQSPLRYIMSEDTARQVVGAELKKQGVQDAYNSKLHDAVFAILPQTVEDHLATANAAIHGMDAWGQAADLYRAQQTALQHEHPIASAAGGVVGTVADLASAGGPLAEAYPAVRTVAGQIVRNYVIPAAKYVGEKSALGGMLYGGYHYGEKALKALGDLFD